MKPALRRAYRRAPWCHGPGRILRDDRRRRRPEHHHHDDRSPGSRGPGASPVHADRDRRADAAGWDTDATIAFVDADGSDVGCAAAPVDAVATRRPAPSIFLPPARYHFKAIYSGNTVLAGSESDPATGGITVDPDSVEAHAVGVSAGSIYPVKDGYRDTVTLSRQSPTRRSPSRSASTTASNKRVRLATKSSATGALLVRVERTRQQGRRAPGGQVPHRPEARRHGQRRPSRSRLRQPVDEEARHRDQDHHEERVRARRLRWQGLEVRDVRASQGRQQRRARRVAVQDPVGRGLQVAVVPGQRVGAAVGARVDHRDAELQPVRHAGTPVASIGSRASATRPARPSGTRRAARRPPTARASPCAAWSASSRAPSTCTRPRSR